MINFIIYYLIGYFIVKFIVMIIEWITNDMFAAKEYIVFELFLMVYPVYFVILGISYFIRKYRWSHHYYD